MTFVLTKHQKEEIKRLDLVKADDEDEVFSSIEARLNESYIQGTQDVTKPIIDAQKNLQAAIKLTQKLNTAIERLEPGMQSRLSELISFSLVQTQPNATGSTQWRPIDLNTILSVTSRYMKTVDDDFRNTYGSRKHDKAIYDLIGFWQMSGRETIEPISNEGAFVNLTAIVLQLDVDAARKAITRLLKAQNSRISRDKSRK